MEKKAKDVLERKMGRIKASNVDPAWLAVELLRTHIIGQEDVKKASSEKEQASKRLEDLIFTVVGNGAPDVFQTFVDILLSENHVKWLGKELKGMAPSLLLANSY